MELNYKGMDNEANFDKYLERARMVENTFREKYTDLLKTFEPEELKSNPAPFRFLKEKHVSLLILILPTEIAADNIIEVFYLSTPNNRSENVYVLGRENLKGALRGNIVRFIEEEILPSLNYNSKQIIEKLTEQVPTYGWEEEYSIFHKNFDFENWLEVHKYTHQERMQRLLQTEMSEYKKINETPLHYFAKDVYKFPFSIIDLVPLVNHVNDEDFAYQLDQAMAAYHENLFLPSAATLGVVLETLCIKILKNNNASVKGSDTQLGKLMNQLSGKKITTRRDQSRLEVAYRMRNLASHSNPGSALKEDCHFMLNVINTIAFEYLKPNSSN